MRIALQNIEVVRAARDNQALRGTALTYALLHQLLQHRKKIFKILKGLKKNISILE